MSDNADAPSVKSRLRAIDLFVLIFFLFTAAAGLYLFQRDLMRTIDSRDEEPAGLIVMRNNIVQRRHEDRVLWDRIFVDSAVYSGDLIRAAELSQAAISIGDASVFLNENTLIRIQRSADGRGPLQLELREGNLSVAAGQDAESGILLNLMGRMVLAGPGTVLNASAGEEGISLQVSEGTARFIDEAQSREISGGTARLVGERQSREIGGETARFVEGRQTREITEGTMISLDEKGAERIAPSAVVMRPASNARYLKTEQENLSVNFSWRRINLDSGDSLSLHTASGPNFTRDFFSYDGLDDSAQVLFGAGQWYWRLMHGRTVLSSGRLTVADGSPLILISPVPDSVIRYRDNPPLLRFQWQQRRDVVYYIVEISQTSNFASSIRRQSASSSLIIQELGQGTWYWRVKPVFLLYEGEAAWSSVSSFTVEKTSDPQAPEIVIPEPVIALVPDPVKLRTGSRYYTIRPGDTLSRIARDVYGDSLLWVKIAEANNIQNPDLIYPDQQFFIP
jgi:LysM repeat protein